MIATINMSLWSARMSWVHNPAG